MKTRLTHTFSGMILKAGDEPVTLQSLIAEVFLHAQTKEEYF